MRRRNFIELLGGAAAAGVLGDTRAPRAQSAMRRIGVLLPFLETDALARAELSAFQDALQQNGWSEGRNLAVDVRWASSDLDLIRANARELVQSQPEVIFARATPVVRALLQVTKMIPIVFMNVGDPVGEGFVASMARPGGNATGFTNVEASVVGKWLELLRELDPRISRCGVMFNPKTAPGGGKFYLRLIEDAAGLLNVQTIALPVENGPDIERAIATFAREPNGGLLVQPDATTTSLRALIIALVLQHRLPAVHQSRSFVAEGALASYGIDLIDVYRRAAGYMDRILRGAKPAELAVQGPVRFELAINLKTAKAIGLELSPILLARADEVME